MTDSKIVARVLKQCNDELRRFIEVNINEVASFMYAKDILNERQFNDVSNPASMYGNDQKATTILRIFSSVVGLDADAYEWFVQFLKSNPSKVYVNMAKVLDENYNKLHTGAVANVPKLDPGGSPPIVPKKGTI